MKKNEIEELIQLLLPGATHGDVVKGSQKWKRRQLSMKWLRAVAKSMGLQRGDYKVRFNPGGWAVGGDATLRTPIISIHVGAEVVGSSAYYRLEKPDSSWIGQNHWIPLERMHDISGCADEIKGLREMSRVMLRGVASTPMV